MMHAIIMFIQFFEVLGAILIGIVFINTAAQGATEVTKELAYAGLSLWAIAVAAALLAFVAKGIAERYNESH